MAVRIRCRVSGTCGHAREDGCAAGLGRLPVISAPRVRIDGMDADRIVFQSIGRADRRTEIEERVDIDLIEKDAESTTYDVAVLGLIGKAHTGCEVVPIRVK